MKATGDKEILDEKLSFLEARELEAGEEDMYSVPVNADEEATLFEHCRRAIERSWKFGAHKMPLMGSGDWSDGLNRVGIGGKGESVWLAWFQCAVLRDFIFVCERYGEKDLAADYRQRIETLSRDIEENDWDGEWYKRAFFDDGTPLGSKENDECQIDAIAQSWSVISGASDPERARIAWESVEKRLVKRALGIIQLFDHGKLEPGYIKGYVPGVRENGGQYSHGALWTIIACALLGKTDTAAELFSLFNPINHSKNLEAATRYKNEPYVITADVHNTATNAGRGGWSWYTGSAAWAYRAVTEFMFGLQKRGDKLRLEPNFPPAWNGGEMIYRFEETVYEFKYSFDASVEKMKIVFDGKELPGDEIELTDDRIVHSIEVRLPAAA